MIRSLDDRSRRLALAFLLLFAVTSLLVSRHLTEPWDSHTLEFFAANRTPRLTTVMQAISWLGNWQGCVPFLLLVAGILWLRKRGRIAWRYLGVSLGAELFWVVLKLAFHRPRPTVVARLGEAGWYSYPSGHASLAPVIWGLGFILLADLFELRIPKITLWILAITVPAIIAFSRPYLGVHYVTDVIGGLAVGVAWVLWWRRALVMPDALAHPA